jgi:hypothetical protein
VDPPKVDATFRELDGAQEKLQLQVPRSRAIRPALRDPRQDTAGGDHNSSHTLSGAVSSSDPHARTR